MSKKINSRSKGARAERQLAKKFSEWWGADFARTPSSGGFSTRKFREDWNASGDLVTPDLEFPFCVESKHGEGWYLEQLLARTGKSLIEKWWEQTVGETPDNQRPLLVFRKNHHPHLFMMRKKDFISVVKTKKSQYPQFVVLKDLVVIGFLEDLFETNPEAWKNMVK